MAHIVLCVPDATPQTYENVEQFVVKNGVLIFTAPGTTAIPAATQIQASVPFLIKQAKTEAPKKSSSSSTQSRSAPPQMKRARA